MAHISQFSTDVASFEPIAEALVSSHPSRGHRTAGPVQIASEFGDMPTAHGESRRPPANGRAPHDFVHAPAQADDATVYGTPQSLGQAINKATEIVASRHDEFSCRGRCRGANVSNEIGNRHIHFMADARDDWHGGPDDRARNDLLVERPQILNRSTATPHDDDIDVSNAAHHPHTSGNIFSRTFTLDPCRPDNQVRIGVPTTEHLDDVANCRSIE
jgi:hypothetical protein